MSPEQERALRAAVLVWEDQAAEQLASAGALTPGRFRERLTPVQERHRDDLLLTARQLRRAAEDVRVVLDWPRPSLRDPLARGWAGD